jgi:hypothetical protein
MTVEKAREMFCSSSDGYVGCDDCPLKFDDCGCKTGYEDCWEAIANYMTKIELAETKKTEAVDHPAHYQGKRECIDEMIALFGVEAVKHFCMCNVYKYRFRAANKNGQEDLDKADWYMDKLMELEKGNV